MRTLQKQITFVLCLDRNIGCQSITRGPPMVASDSTGGPRDELFRPIPTSPTYLQEVLERT
jgi:hypothetical protein